MFGLFKTVLWIFLLKKFSRVVVVYCSIIKVLFCRSFQATAFIFYQKLFSLSRTFLFFCFVRFGIFMSASSDSFSILSHSDHSVNNFFWLIFNLSNHFQPGMSRLRVFSALPFFCCSQCCSSATNVILPCLFLIVNVFYIFHAILNILIIQFISTRLFLSQL